MRSLLSIAMLALLLCQKQVLARERKLRVGLQQQHQTVSGSVDRKLAVGPQGREPVVGVDYGGSGGYGKKKMQKSDKMNMEMGDGKRGDGKRGGGKKMMSDGDDKTGGSGKKYKMSSGKAMAMKENKKASLSSGDIAEGKRRMR